MPNRMSFRVAERPEPSRPPSVPLHSPFALLAQVLAVIAGTAVLAYLLASL